LKKRRAGRARDATDPSNASELVVTGSRSLRFLFIVVAAFYLLVP
jgi:hypothetical protein